MEARVFIVEDDEIITHVIREILAKRGYAVAGTAATGEDALEKIPRAPCDVILMDIGLRGDTDGVTVARVLSSKIRTPIIFVTAQFDEQILERAKTPITYGYIIKPFTANDLCSNIEIALFSHRLRSGTPEESGPVAAQAPARPETPPAEEPVPIRESRPRIPNAGTKNLYDHAVFYQSRGNYARALQYFIELLQADPDDAPAWIEKGDVLMNMGRIADALESVNTGLALDPASGYALCKKCRILCNAGRFAEALETIEAALRLTSDKRALLVEKGMILHELGRSEEAIAILDAAIGMNNKCGYALGAKGRVLEKLGKTNEALLAFRRALSIEPKNISLWMDLVRLFEHRRNYHTALNVLQLALEKNPGNELLAIKRDTLLHRAIPVS